MAMELTKVLTAGFAEPDKDGVSPPCEWINYDLDAMGKAAVIEAVAADTKRRTDLFRFGTVGIVRASLTVNLLLRSDKMAERDQVDILRTAIRRIQDMAVAQADYDLAADALALFDRATAMLDGREEPR